MIHRLLLLFLLATTWTGPASADKDGFQFTGGSARNTGISYPWRFAYVADTHWGWNLGGTNPRNYVPFYDVIDSLNTLRATSIGMDFMVLTSDWSESLYVGNAQAQRDSVPTIMARANFPIWPVLGNWEALASDTLARRDPYYTAIQRFPGFFEGRDWYMKDWKNLRFVSLEDNTDYNTSDPTADYRVNNPFYSPAVVPGYDYNGITVTGSAQRLFLRNALRTRDKSHWFVVGLSRPVYGSDDNASNRHSFGRAARGTGFVKEVEDSLITGERCLFLCGDQHLPVWITKAIRDSAVASSTGKGGYHMIVASGSGARVADTTNAFTAGTLWLEAYLARKESDPTKLFGRTSEAWADTLTSYDGGLVNTFTWTLFTVYADHILVETFRTWTTQSITPIKHPKSNGARNHKLIDKRTISRDVG